MEYLAMANLISNMRWASSSYGSNFYTKVLGKLIEKLLDELCNKTLVQSIHKIPYGNKSPMVSTDENYKFHYFTVRAANHVISMLGLV